jgi:uncharacterized protein (DUF1697 family)
MKTWIALLRGINVLGRRKLPMGQLVAELEKLGLSDIRTYIQSGNVVFRSRRRKASALAAQITKAIGSSHGFEPQVMVLSVEELAEAVAGNPFPTADEEPTTVHLFFMAAPPTHADLEAIDALRAGREEYVLYGNVFYLRTPDGFGRSKLAQKAERLLGVPTTARNWRSVNRILEMAEEAL